MEAELAHQVVRMLESDQNLAQPRSLDRFGGEENERLVRYYKLFRSLADDLGGEVEPGHIRAEVTAAPRDRCCLIEVFHPALRYVRKNYMPPEIYAFMARLLIKRGIQVPPAPAASEP